MPTTTATPSAKRFQQTIRQTMQELMLYHNYSRVDATRALIYAIAGNAAEPSEPDVIHIMNTHGIGSEEAKAALLVSATLDETCLDKKMTLSKALADVTKRVTTKYVLESRISAQQGGQSEIVDTEAAQEKLAAVPTTTVPPASLSTISDTVSEASVSSLAALSADSAAGGPDSTITALQTPLAATKKPKHTSAVKSATSMKKTRSRLASISEDKPTPSTKDQHSRSSSTTSSAGMATRSRSDSVDTQVTNKLGSAAAAAASAPTPAATSVASSTRTKRSRSDDTSSNTATPAAASTKRQRPSRA